MEILWPSLIKNFFYLPCPLFAGFPVCEDDIEDGQLEEEDVEQDEQLEPASTTTTLTGSHPHTSSTLIATSGAAVTTVSSISEQVSSVMVASGDMDDDDPPPTKRKPQPIVWGQPSSCKSYYSVRYCICVSEQSHDSGMF